MYQTLSILQYCVDVSLQTKLILSRACVLWLKIMIMKSCVKTCAKMTRLVREHKSVVAMAVGACVCFQQE